MGRLRWWSPRIRRLLGDVILTEEDIVSKRDFPDGCVPSTLGALIFTIQRNNMLRSFPISFYLLRGARKEVWIVLMVTPFHTVAFTLAISKICFMAGRCISVTHEALGTVRVMKTCGMMGGSCRSSGINLCEARLSSSLCL